MIVLGRIVLATVVVWVVAIYLIIDGSALLQPGPPPVYQGAKL